MHLLMTVSSGALMILSWALSCIVPRGLIIVSLLGNKQLLKALVS